MTAIYSFRNFCQLLSRQLADCCFNIFKHKNDDKIDKFTEIVR